MGTIKPDALALSRRLGRTCTEKYLAHSRSIGDYPRDMSSNSIIVGTLMTIVLSILVVFCTSPDDVMRDRPRQVVTWEQPADFEPSYLTETEDGTRWGLFVSKRYSGKDNFWAVRSVDGGPWERPIRLMNAYYFADLALTVQHDTISLEFYQIDDSYFYDYNRFLEMEPDFPETVTVSLALSHLEADDDRDGLLDRIEEELMLSVRLPDSDADGKIDALDFCPLAKPRHHDPAYEIYITALVELMDLDDIAGLVASHDTAWSTYYDTYYLHEPNVAYVAMPGEPTLPELPGLPIVLIQVKSPLVYAGKQIYASFTGGIVPHLVFYGPQIDMLGDDATMSIEYVERTHRRERATMHFARGDEGWRVVQVVKDE